MFSTTKSFAMQKKTNNPISCLRWKPTGRIFKTFGLRWVPPGKIFIDSTTQVDSEPPNGLNDDIINPYECDQTLNVSAGTSFNPKKERLIVWLLNRLISHKPGVQGSQMSCGKIRWRLLTTLQASLLKEKKGQGHYREKSIVPQKMALGHLL
nr:hypothetical protein [Tanacetum cinerariifolium]